MSCAVIDFDYVTITLLWSRSALTRARSLLPLIPIQPADTLAAHQAPAISVPTYNCSRAERASTLAPTRHLSNQRDTNLCS